MSGISTSTLCGAAPVIPPEAGAGAPSTAGIPVAAPAPAGLAAGFVLLLGHI